MSGGPVAGPAAGTPDPTQPKDPDRSLTELLSSLSTDVSDLVSTQLELAKVEVKEEVTKAAKGAGMLSGGAVAGLVAIVFLSHAAAWGLAAIIPDPLAFLVVGLVWAAIAAVLALQGKGKLQATDPVPHATVAELGRDRDLAQEQMGRG